ncbi:hypothetical protein GUJ93_ZPchr0007g3047 [Zizania palustris]|uniref:Uncharacterized protein n=1 Tax=Zizania palustris TaxID=103762 RepID=A0A8J5TE85_ZIZPA|nr:hypothetical protein GUJ93_ZPchr0007g3047 [Zizania palustris]
MKPLIEAFIYTAALVLRILVQLPSLSSSCAASSTPRLLLSPALVAALVEVEAAAGLGLVAWILLPSESRSRPSFYRGVDEFYRSRMYATAKRFLA